MTCSNKKRETGRIVWLLLLLLFVTWSLCGQAAAITMVSVAGEKVNLRKGPSAQYPVIWELGKGFPLQVIGSKGNWLKVSDFEKDVGWIYKELVSRKPHLIVKVNKNSKARINIRSGPGTSYKIVGQAEYGVVFATLTREQGWVKVQHEKGLTGWIKRSLLWGW
ncbi:MAG: peptide-binding protein [Desulfobacterales bacterium SG8_35_2]|jgi:SH3-like domain-containing protein|nr:MAG: peptide-binding protein [Desulfobacterales bacterium SG8_35_2]